MGDAVTTMTVIVFANAILLPLAAYASLRLGLLPGVDWYWPFQRHPKTSRSPSPQDKGILSGHPVSLSRRVLELAEAWRTTRELMREMRKDGTDAPRARTSAHVDLQFGDTLMQSTGGKLYLIPFPLESFEVRDQAEIQELQREAQQVPQGNIVVVRLLPARPGQHSRASIELQMALRAWLRSG